MMSEMQILRIDDLIITVAYFSIPVQIVLSLIRYPRLAAMPLKILILMILFALFIFLCGTGHLMRCLRYTDASAFFLINWFTALVSLATATYLLPLVPNLMSTLDAGLQELHRLNEESEESRRKLVTFMAFLCHEIRNPLFAVTSFCAFLDDEDLSSTQERALASIQQSTQLMIRLVNDVLDISKLESGRLDLEKEEFNLQELLQNVGTSTEMQLNQKPSIGFKFHLSPSVPEVAIGDSARILQIAYNLLSNAAKFTDEGLIEFSASVVTYEEALRQEWINTSADQGSDNKLIYDGDKRVYSSVTSFETEVDEDDFALRLLSAEEGTSGTLLKGASVCVLKIEVSDTGAGISTDLLERIFVPYSWSKLTEYREQGGTGLGLAILSKLARKMGGNIHVTSTEGAGSTFTVYLQLQIMPEPTSQTKEYFKAGTDVMMPSSGRALAEPISQGHVAHDTETEGFHQLCAKINGSSSSLEATKTAELLNSGECNLDAAGSPGARKRKPSVDLFTFDSHRDKILIVDDNHINRKLLGRMVSHFNLEYELASNGQEAVDIMMQSRNKTQEPTATQFGLIIMDLSMPVLDGCQATRILRGSNLDIPILALTACALDANKQEAIEAGVTEFLTKPILRDLLLEKCKYYLLGESSSEREVI
jgi:signal transduction histidine kinase/ActR/RegA family two-component response regulator